METVSSPEVFLHIKVVMGMVISLSLARVLTGLAGIVQHPAKAKVYTIHLGWALSMFLFIIHIWWWEYRLQAVPAIGFGIYLFLICFCSLFFLLCALLFPASLDEYGGYEEYFISRRKWFFGILGLTYAVDILDTAIKGHERILSLGWEYPARNIVYILLCAIAAWTPNRRFHATFVIANLIYQISFIFRLYDVLG
ncbi:hypothetical protein ACCS70_22585 [Rhizobium ruizarguesonis]|uniref:hypothetical protein n=1 Tax=Rhizobium ruizarguesonis TaxID=2081791 RepID=UPI0009499AED|nr:hypothetical protein [Rhizobium ruizarguesonis]NEJ15900.1 hypothetical protein [Rhizobium ruizarguesonis]NEK29821.1 hypothetical protein [Rhizobium ruizarguesonis]TAX77094.1 hypothetical protein ELI00_13095 [Rhizobium ruizarguesonis]TAZ84198.1 hypothetical protein ELH72_13585 [Rhizobium ruizarguesonis]UED29756.1 hypothetical protein BSO17_14915 [Rhizobium ruizarguesonis]